MADQWEKAAKLGSERRLGEAQARKILSEIYETVNNEPLRSATVRDYLTTWSEGKKQDTAARTQEAYAQVTRDFVGSLGNKADADISQITKADCAAYRDQVLKRTSVATSNKSLKYLRVALNAAVRDGLAQDNPAAKISTLTRRHDEASARRPFTIPELKRVLQNANQEWRGLILFGLYTGQRLKDSATLTWRNLDMENNQFRLVTGKTSRQMNLPIAGPLLLLIQAMSAPDDPGAPLFPELFKIGSKQKDDSRLSQQFYGILVAAGLAKERENKSAQERADDEKRNGRTLRRTVNALSFHSLRHTATSLLKVAGVPESVVRDIIGHDTVAISRQYTHVDDRSKADALAKLPSLGQ